MTTSKDIVSPDCDCCKSNDCDFDPYADEFEIVRGGQGRTPENVESNSFECLGWMMLGCVIILIVTLYSMMKAGV